MVVSCHVLTCGKPWQWMCNNGECIALYDLCNGIAQCTDGSDEIDCDKRQWQDKYMSVPREEMMSVIRSGIGGVSPTSSTTTSALQSTVSNEWLVAVALILFIILLVVITLQCRRRRNGLVRSNRAYNIRKSLNMEQNDGEDEDDLLIGSLYS
ncbi:low-density lipoprotein receptor domain class A containing protein [Loa loa]|uniref:Low-density lipoprotein receptor domain class A containing protein n=2 Tax=Loa loa TaxID=7209 RepID=A0A1I7VY54_LOALO|nr:low-density lipoprotein receptor domain class A containing protein [Loa loa]EFO21185.1 low-density lipoprotein receptor domain class A containing protein [Loa loa]